jgi:hypothetical protein
VKNSISQIKKALIEKKISVGELYDEYLAKLNLVITTALT